MEHKSVIVTNGNIYEKETGKKIYLSDGYEFVIIGQPQGFLQIDPFERKFTLNKSEEKESLVSNTQ